MKMIVFYLLVAICILTINNLLHSIIDTWQKQKYITDAQKSLVQEQEYHQQLEQELKVVSKQSFIEEQARDKLLMVKPGEEIVLIPSNLLSPTPSHHQSNSSTKPHWQAWFNYFFQ